MQDSERILEGPLAVGWDPEPCRPISAHWVEPLGGFEQWLCHGCWISSSLSSQSSNASSISEHGWPPESVSQKPLHFQKYSSSLLSHISAVQLEKAYYNTRETNQKWKITKERLDFIHIYIQSNEKLHLISTNRVISNRFTILFFRDREVYLDTISFPTIQHY